jgi:hypothetical protein
MNGDSSSAISGVPAETTTAKQGSNVGTYPITIAQGTLAAANYSFQFKNGTLTVTALGTTAMPVFTPAAGTYTSIQPVKISSSTPGSVIYYTTNGSPPTTSSTKYSTAIQVALSETLSAIAVAPGYTQSAVKSSAYTINLAPAATPLFKPTAGTYTSAQTVIVTSATNGATIYYTTNGTTPTTSSAKYAPTGIKVSATETIQAIAVAAGYSNSAPVTAAYIIATTPSVTTSAANGVGTSGATLNGTVTAHNAATQYWFAYGVTKTSLTSVTAKTPGLTGTTATTVSATVAGLKSRTTYNFQVVASNAVGTTSGTVLSFTTN